jgi:putative glutamine amidotransferase
MAPLIVLSRGVSPVTSYVKRLSAGAETREVRTPDEIPEKFDALCLTGGPDVWWRLYGQRRNGSGDPDIARDYLELEHLLPIAFRERKPILAICRGLQVLNVYLGGTLVQDIGEEHRAAGDDVKPHKVRVQQGSRVAEACGLSLTVNSRHHQVLGRIAAELTPVAWSDDEHVEGAEVPGDHWIVGVQWHPERVQDGIADNGIRIFDRFIEAAQPVAAR